jgi:hypothetical protein
MIGLKTASIPAWVETLRLRGAGGGGGGFAASGGGAGAGGSASSSNFISSVSIWSATPFKTLSRAPRVVATSSYVLVQCLLPSASNCSVVGLSPLGVRATFTLKRPAGVSFAPGANGS